MRLFRAALVATTVLATACASDGTSAPTNNSPQFESKLAAVATAPTATLADPTLTVNVAVTNTLSETVSGGVCASTVQARAVNSSTWTDVTASFAVCPQQAAIVPAGATVNFRGVADPAKVRAVLGGNTGTVVFKVQHSLAGSSTNYMLQSNEVTWVVI